VEKLKCGGGVTLSQAYFFAPLQIYFPLHRLSLANNLSRRLFDCLPFDLLSRASIVIPKEPRLWRVMQRRRRFRGESRARILLSISLGIYERALLDFRISLHCKLKRSDLSSISHIRRVQKCWGKAYICLKDYHIMK
jgi:hypothetical protein